MLKSLRQFFKQLSKSKEPKKDFKKPAIALITYSRVEYFTKVFDSITKQEINNKPFNHYFDLYVFQDGLLAGETPEQVQSHREIAELIRSNPNELKYFPQTKNLGVALHFDFIERFLFNKQDCPWVAFCEDDLVLSPGYLETLLCMANSFKDDERVAMFSCFGKTSNQSIENQKEHQNDLITMEHHWGFGMHQLAWRKRQPLVDEYLKLVSSVPYRERNHVAIQNWHDFCGFRPGATSQDYAKACAMAAMECIKVSSYANFATYVGEYGLHFTPELYAQKGFAQSNVFPTPINRSFCLNDSTYKSLLQKQQSITIKELEKFDSVNFKQRLEIGALAPNNSDQWLNSSITEADVVAAYKIFLGRWPENREVIKGRIGMSPEKLFASFMTSTEFRDRKQFYPVLVALAKEIIEKSKSK